MIKFLIDEIKDLVLRIEDRELTSAEVAELEYKSEQELIAHKSELIDELTPEWYDYN
jgi:hypothetical protein